MAEFNSPPISLDGNSDFILGKDHQGTLSFSGSSSLLVSSSLQPFMGTGSFIVEGLKIERHEAGYFHVAKYVGEPNVPHDIKAMRRSVYDLMRRMGTPILVKKMLVESEIPNGTVEKSPNLNSVYGQTRNHDPLSHGVGFISTEKSTNEWVNLSTSEIISSKFNPGTGFEEAPKYRGYGPGYLIFIIEPDVAVDYFKTTPQGAFMKVQTATAQAPWWPDINDNDLLIHVELDSSGFIIGSQDRYQAKTTNPISIRGAKERRGRRDDFGDYPSRYVINRTFEMTALPKGHVAYEVEIDR